jgi:hypothetical protein
MGEDVHVIRAAALLAAWVGLAGLGLVNLSVPASAAQFKVDGERLYVSGEIYGRHEFETMSKLVRDNPKVSIVVMKDFYGGTAGTAGFFNFTKFIRDRKLATEVDGACFSACAVAFMGGVKRSVSPKADPKKSFVAFHGAYFGGGQPDHEFRATFVSALRRYSGGKMPEMVARIAYAMPPDGFLLFLDPRKAKPKDGISVIACKSKKEVDSGGCTGITDIDSRKVGVFTH